MKVATGEIMRAIDKSATEEFNIPSILLMENAALSVVSVINNCVKNILRPNIVIVAGKGNNGGDGFCIARHLYQKNMNVNIIFIGDINDVSGDALINLNIAKALDIPLTIIKSENEMMSVNKLISSADITVDAILGTGISGATRGVIKQIIHIINKNSKYTIAVDIPSGIKSETGNIEGEVIKANKTITFGLIKQGLLLYPAKEYVGELILVDIGIPKQVIENINITTNILEPSDIIQLMPQRIPRSNKGTYGKLMVIGGSKEMTGAPILTCKSAYKTGVGLVNLVAPEEVINTARCNIIENINTTLPSDNGKVCLESFSYIKDIINKVDAIAIGPGLGQGEEVTKFVCELLHNTTVPVVIDADGLNAVSNDLGIFKTSKSQIIITPHPGEMSRLTGISINDILCNTIEVVRDFSKKYNVITLLKDARTIIGNSQNEIYINTTGNSSMAKAGSGDVLTGIIGALLAQGVQPFISATLGAYIHGKAGEKASQKLGLYSVTASNLCDFIIQ